MTSEDDLRARVRQVVDMSGRSHAALAHVIGMAPTKLSKSLAGTRRFTPLELASIAEQTGTSIDWLLSGTPPRPTLAARVQEAVGPGSADPACRRAEDLDEVYETLLTSGGRARAPLRIPPPNGGGLMIDQGAALADQALQVIAEAGEQERTKDQLAGVIEQVLDIDVAIENFPEGFDGLAWCRDGFRLILVSTAVSWTRQRFTLAHELGHVLAGDAQDLRLDLDVMAPVARRELTEMRANAFAAEFLVPRDTLTAAWQRSDATTFPRLVWEFRVSPSALSWRLRNLGLIDSREQQRLGSWTLWGCAERGGWVDEYVTSTQRQSEVRRPGLLSRSALDAFTEGAVSAVVAARVLQVAPDTLLNGSVSSLSDDDTELCNDENGMVFAP